MMSDKQTFDEKYNQHQCYEIRLKGHLDARWVKWFDGLAITLDDNGNTLLSGPVADQAALHGILKKVRDVGLPCFWLIPLSQIRKREREVTPVKSSPRPG
jgi:hypothetical protein